MVAKPRTYVVIIGDIVRSRRLSRKRRSTIQSRLKEVFVTLNRGNKRTVTTPLQFTAGDEFQGVLQNPGSAPLVIREVREAIAPVFVRFGIGIGEISTPVSAEPQSMDGPAFHRARAGIERSSEFLDLICVISATPTTDDVVNGLFDLLGVIRSKWSTRVQEVIRLYDQYQKLEPVAKRLNISAQAVSKHLRVSGYRAYARGEVLLMRFLAEYNQPPKVEFKKST